MAKYLDGTGLAQLWTKAKETFSASGHTHPYSANSTKLYASDSPYRYGDSSPYYAYFTYNVYSDNRWYLRVYPETPKTVAVDYAYDSDKLDGKHASDFATSGHTHSYLPLSGGTITGPLEISTGALNNTYNEGLRITKANNDWAGITFGSTGLSGAPSGGWFAALNPSGQFIINPDDSGNTAGLTLNKGGNLMWRNNVVIHAGNYTSYCAAASHTHSYLPLSGGAITGAITIKGVVNSGQYSQGGFNGAYANIVLQGDNTYGVSGIVFKSMHANDVDINTPSDVAFIQYHPKGVTASAYNTTPTEVSTTGAERSRFVIGVGNDADNGSNSVGEELWLQTAGANDLKHYVVNTGYTILDSGNFSTWASPVGHTHSGYASASHTHDYLPLSGGTVTGAFNVKSYGISVSYYPLNESWVHIYNSKDSGESVNFIFNSSVYCMGGFYDYTTGNSWIHTGNYSSYALPLSGGTLTGTLNIAGGAGISDASGNGMLVYHPSSWTGVTSSEWGVGAIDSVGVIRSSAADLKHYRGGTNYVILDSYNVGSYAVSSSVLTAYEPRYGIVSQASSSFTAAVETYYRFDNAVGTITITLPAPSGNYTHSIFFYFTTGSGPAVTFSSTKPIVYYSDFSIAASKTYEINALYNGSKWVMAYSTIG